MNAFADSCDATEACLLFSRLLSRCGVDPRDGPAIVPALAARLGRRLPRRLQQLMVALRTRQMQPQYFPAEREEAEGGGVEEGERPACAGMGAVVVGAGPIGLRSAIELALLGCGVVVLESRQARRVVQCMVYRVMYRYTHTMVQACPNPNPHRLLPLRPSRGSTCCTCGTLWRMTSLGWASRALIPPPSPRPTSST